MIYLLEGIDGAGKTSIGNAIQAKLGGKRKVFMRHSPKPKKSDKRDIIGFYYKDMEKAYQKQDVVLDRWWPSHLVYETYFGKRQWLRREEMFIMVGLFLQQTVYVHCHAPLGVIQGRIQSDRDLNLTPQQRQNQIAAAEEIMVEYERLYRHLVHMRCGRNVLANTDEHNPNELADKVLLESKLGLLPRQKEEHLRTLRAVGWGSVTPQVLVIGNRNVPHSHAVPTVFNRKGHGNRIEHLPFIATRGRGYDHHVLRVLIAARLSPADVYFHNAWRSDEPSTPLLTPEIVRALSPLMVVTVGKRAAKWWEANAHRVSSVRGTVVMADPKEYKELSQKDVDRLGGKLRNTLNEENILRKTETKFLEGFYHADHFQP